MFQRFEPRKGRKLPWIIEGVDRTSIPRVLGELEFKVGAEVGVAQGNHAKILCDNIPNLKLYCVDVWERYHGYYEYTNRIRKYYREAQERLAPYDCVFIKKFSMDAVKDFDRQSLDFVYIDAAHDFQSVSDDLCQWIPKVRYGGVVFGHDYKLHRGKRGERYIVHVRHVVQAYMYCHAIDPWFEVRIPRQASWMFVRQEGDFE
jgi:predicted O-methyltransferase YrrM